VNEKGSTRAITPPRLSLMWAKSMKFEANPAWPLPNKVRLYRLSFIDIACCSSAEVPNPANDGTGTWAIA